MALSLLNIILLIISGIILFFLILPFLTILLSFLGSEKLASEKEEKKFDFACIITAYKNAEITKPLIQSILNQDYKNFEIYVMADNCDISNWDLEHEQLSIFSPQPPLNLKVKSIIYAVEQFKRDHDYTIIFDADNLAHPDFFKVINKYCNSGHRTIQGQRTAKNLDTMYACADSLGEFYKNYIERYAPYLIGSSAVISGSGMAVETDLYKEYLYGAEISEGKHLAKKMLQEDKILQNVLLSKNEKIAYAWDAIVYDEKVVSGDQVETQRSRWIYSYFQNLPNSLGFIFKGIKNFSFNQFFFGLMTASFPLFILVFIALCLTILNFFINPWMSYALFAGLGIFSLNVFFSLYLSKVPSQVWKAVWGLPMFIVNQVKGMLKMGNPNKNFKASEHTRSVSIEELVGKEGKE